MPFVAGVRWTFRGKDAGSADSRGYRRDRGRSIGASSAPLRHKLRSARPSSRGTPVRTQIRLAEPGAQDIAIRVTWSPVDPLPRLGGHRREAERTNRLEP